MMPLVPADQRGRDVVADRRDEDQQGGGDHAGIDSGIVMRRKRRSGCRRDRCRFQQGTVDFLERDIDGQDGDGGPGMRQR
jgi:hypothetical protein